MLIARTRIDYKTYCNGIKQTIAQINNCVELSFDIPEVKFYLAVLNLCINDLVFTQHHKPVLKRISEKKLEKLMTIKKYQDKSIKELEQLEFKKETDVYNENVRRYESAIKYLNSDMPHALLLGIDPDYITRILKQNGLLLEVSK